jgi:ech hydrogenase subunit B
MEYLFSSLTTACAPVAGGLLYGFERIIKARMQNRQGPPLIQPFYDFFKLIDKRPIMVHSTHAFLGLMHALAVWTALAIMIFGGDLLLVIFLHALASVLLILGAYSAKSIFSHIGANREVLSELATEPILILASMGFYFCSGSFSIETIMSSPSAFLSLPLIYLSILLIAPIKLKKSPFDIAEAHQEVIGGPEIEYSGIFYEAIYTAKWLENIFIYYLLYLFAGSNLLLGLILTSSSFLLFNIIDNSTARLSWQQMLKTSFCIALPLTVTNLLFIVW